MQAFGGVPGDPVHALPCDVSRRVFRGPRCLMTSALKRPLTLSASAASQQSQASPTQGATPASANRPVWRIDRSCDPQSEYCIKKLFSNGFNC